MDHPKHSIQQGIFQRYDQSTYLAAPGSYLPQLRPADLTPFPEVDCAPPLCKANYLSQNIIDADIQHFLLVLLPFMVLPTWQEYHSSLFKAADALLVVTVYRLWSNPSIHPSSTALKIFMVKYHPRCSWCIIIYYICRHFWKFEIHPIWWPP